jgi:DNA-binding MarR family transcriptional regulator
MTVIGDTVATKEQAVARIMAAQERMAHLFAMDRSNPLLSVNLTMPQLKILLVLSLRGGASGQDLTSVMGVSLATITGIVDRLAAQGLVGRREDPRDRRVRRIELTAKGAELVERVMATGAEHQRRLLQRMTAHQLAVVEEALGIMLEAAEADAARMAAQAGDDDSGTVRSTLVATPDQPGHS